MKKSVISNVKTDDKEEFSFAVEYEYCKQKQRFLKCKTSFKSKIDPSKVYSATVMVFNNESSAEKMYDSFLTFNHQNLLTVKSLFENKVLLLQRVDKSLYEWLRSKLRNFNDNAIWVNHLGEEFIRYVRGVAQGILFLNFNNYGFKCDWNEIVLIDNKNKTAKTSIICSAYALAYPQTVYSKQVRDFTQLLINCLCFPRHKGNPSFLEKLTVDEEKDLSVDIKEFLKLTTSQSASAMFNCLPSSVFIDHPAFSTDQEKRVLIEKINVEVLFHTYTRIPDDTIDHLDTKLLNDKSFWKENITDSKVSTVLNHAHTKGFQSMGIKKKIKLAKQIPRDHKNSLPKSGTPPGTILTEEQYIAIEDRKNLFKHLAKLPWDCLRHINRDISILPSPAPEKHLSLDGILNLVETCEEGCVCKVYGLFVDYWGSQILLAIAAPLSSSQAYLDMQALKDRRFAYLCYLSSTRQL